MKKFQGACPGAIAIKGTPELKEKTCPNCGEIIEIFSNETESKCKCGFVAYNNIQNCIKWCAFARECVGGEIYDNLDKSRLTE